jgi:hypothetical protein
MKRLHYMTAGMAVLALVAAKPAVAQQPNTVAGEVASVAHPPAAGQPIGARKGGQIIATAKQTPACQSIIQECKQLGFVVGQWKTDNGLWKDCFTPVVHGKTATRDGQPVQVQTNPSNVKACRSAVFKTE